MIRLVISFSFLTLSNIILAQDSVSVLFIGNSYTDVNSLPTLLNNLTISKGDKLTFDSRTQGGATFKNHSENSLTYSKIHSKPWDYVIMQGQSQEVSFSDSQVNSQSLPYAKQIADSVYSAKYCTELMLFMTWGYLNGDSQWAPISTYEGMQLRTRNGYQRIADSVQASVAPVGAAWKYVRDNHPTINLYSGDGSHPSFEGSYLAACTFYASLYRKSPVGATYYGSLSQAVAEQLQHAAEIAVMDSLDLWHLRSLGNHTIADFSVVQNGAQVICTNKSWKAQSFDWTFGDGGSSTDKNPVYNYTLNGSFSIELDATSECDSDRTDKLVQVTAVGLNDIKKSSLNLYSYGSGKFKVTGTNFDSNTITVIDLNGRVLSNWNIQENELFIDLSNESKGIYRVAVGTNTFSISNN